MKLPFESLLEPLSADQQERLATVLSDYLDGIDRGWAPPFDELVAANPDLARPLREYQSSLNLLQRAADGVNVRPRKPVVLADVFERQLGDYRLVREIGRGGMGIVYEARQLSLGRTVALKLLPFAALLDQKQISRFQNEAQAAAGLHHPHIVSVFAVGCERGVHYYSMQFIDGQSLDHVIEDLRQDPANHAPGSASTQKPNAPHVAAVAGTNPIGGSLSTVRSVRTRNYVRAAVELIMQAADALHYAHECGVVHRDIKPSNLLLDRHGKLWVTDFGLARCEVGPELTATGDVLGTLRYMSPEQATGKPQLIDHRTDVYSLGVTLFELLTLRPAFEGNERADILRRIREDTVPSLRSLNPAVPYDLETIVLKATAKSRDDCYSSAAEFREDLRRFLAGEPARARRATLADRGVKWIVRHKRVAAAAICALLILLTGVSSALALLAAKQAETDRALVRARAHFAEVQEVVDRFGAGVSEKLREVPGAEPVRGELLRDTLVYYETILEYAGEEPTLRADAAKAAFKAGAVHEQIGDNEQALVKYRLAHQFFLQLIESNPSQPVHQADLALCDNNLGSLLTRLGNLVDAEDALRAGIRRQQALTRTYPAEPRYRHDLALSQINLGLALADAGQMSSAKSYYRDAVRELQRGDSGPADVNHRHRLSNAFYNLSGLVADDNPGEAESLARQAVNLLRSTDSARARADLALGLSNLGTLLNRQSKLAEAMDVLREAIAIQEQLAREAPHVVAHRVDLASTRNNLGQTLLDSGSSDAARVEFETAQQLIDKLTTEFPDDPIHFGGLAGVLNNLGMIRERQGDLQGAAESFERAIQMQHVACNRAPRVVRYRDFLDRHYANLSRVLESLGREDEAEQIRQKSDVSKS
jgi:serine/threonine protein kinase/Flp pilus assembly protein TadD